MNKHLLCYSVLLCIRGVLATLYFEHFL